MYRRLDGRVKKWVTLNEPWVITDGGYLHGALAPGHRNLFETPIASHNLMRAHGRAVQAYRSEGAHEIGLVVNIEPKYPASDSPEDVAATARARLYEPPISRSGAEGQLPRRTGRGVRRSLAAMVRRGFARHRCQPLDFIGINYYTRNVVKADPNQWPVGASPVRAGRDAHDNRLGVYPPALTDMLVWFRDTYGDIPVYITENGAAFYDPPVAGPDGIDDPLRCDYLRTHISAIGDAIERKASMCTRLYGMVAARRSRDGRWAFRSASVSSMSIMRRRSVRPSAARVSTAA